MPSERAVPVRNRTEAYGTRLRALCHRVWPYLAIGAAVEFASAARWTVLGLDFDVFIACGIIGVCVSVFEARAVCTALAEVRACLWSRGPTR